MTQKKDKHPKTELLLGEREAILEQIKEIDNYLLSKEDVDLGAISLLKERIESRDSFSRLTTWLQKHLRISPDTSEKRLNAVIQVLENEFPATKTPNLQQDHKFADSKVEKQEQSQNLFRSIIIFILLALLDNALILHVIGHNNAAIIELYGAVERFAINKLCDTLIVPEKQTIGLKLIERRTLPDLASLLGECEIFEKGHIKFCSRLSRLRNGLAHRNTEVVSRSILGGKEISELELDVAVTDKIFFEYLIGTIRVCGAIMTFEVEEIDSEQIPLGFLSENE